MSYFAEGQEGRETEYCDSHDEVKAWCAKCLTAQLTAVQAKLAEAESLREYNWDHKARADAAEAKLATTIRERDAAAGMAEAAKSESDDLTAALGRAREALEKGKNLVGGMPGSAFGGDVKLADAYEFVRLSRAWLASLPTPLAAEGEKL